MLLSGQPDRRFESYPLRHLEHLPQWLPGSSATVYSRNPFGGLRLRRLRHRLAQWEGEFSTRTMSNPELVAASGQWKLRIVIYSRADGLFNMQPSRVLCLRFSGGFPRLGAGNTNL
jgi:hypothetical protein